MWSRSFLVVLGVVVAGCGGESLGVDLPPLTLEEYCAQLGPADCPALVACGVHLDLASCVDARRDGGCDHEAPRVVAGRMAFDGEAARDCILERQASTSCPPAAGPIEACEAVFTGRMPDGDVCSSGDDCVDGSYCAGLAVHCPGRCAPRKRLGSPVTELEECADDLYAYAGACRRRVATGGGCAPAEGETREQWCEQGSFCDETNTCVPEQGAGGRCGPRVGLCADSDCIDGRCQRYRRLGEACDGLGGITGRRGRCAAGLYCEGIVRDEGGFCAIPRALGEACPGHVECAEGLQCSPLGTCAPLPAAGEPCADGNRCGPGLACNNDSRCVELASRVVDCLQPAST
jgi:hypothetical protein